MVPLLSTVQDVIVSFAPLFSKRVFAHVTLLITGAILAPGKRTVTSVLRVLGKGDEPHFQRDHRVLNRAKWSALNGGKILLRLLVETFVPSGPVLLGIDKTIERRWGAKITTQGIYRDPMRSSHSHVVKASGLRRIGNSHGLFPLGVRAPVPPTVLPLGPALPGAPLQPRRRSAA
jgi:hypothetical protein